MLDHNIKCVGEASFNLVFEALGREFGNIYARRFSGNQKVGVMFGERYFLMVNSDVALAIVLKSMSS